MRVLLLHLDGKLPNLALMRVSAHHKALGDQVELRRAGNIAAVERHLLDAGVQPRHIMVYVLIGYWPKETIEGWEYRRVKLRELGVLPYPMCYKRTRETVGFQRWVIGGYDKKVSWAEWEAMGYQAHALRRAKRTKQPELPL